MITEFSASGSSLVDDEGDASDWIEIYNTASVPVDLMGYALTDDALAPQKWALPNIRVQPGAYQVVFASGKNRGLHTNFRLADAGEYLALIRPGGSVASEYAPTYPEQAEGFSYGQVFEGLEPTEARGFFGEPTPGAANGAVTANPGMTLSISPGGRAFVDTLEIEIEPPDEEEAVIHYTLDGSMPDRTSPILSGSLVLNTTATVRARTFARGMLGPVRTEIYFAIDGALAEFRSNLPIIVVRSEAMLERVNTQPGQALINGLQDDGRAGLLTSGITTEAGFRLRGSSSSYFPKQQFAFETRNAFGEDRPEALLGLPAESDWVLNAPYSDKTFLRNHLAYTWFRAMGHWAPRSRFVEVFVAQPTEEIPTGAVLTMANYVGVYVLLEKVKRAPERVDIARLRPTDIEGDAITGGYIIARDRPAIMEQGFLTGSGTLMSFVEPKENDIPAAQRDYILGHLNGLEQMFQRDDWRDQYEGWIEVDPFIDHHLLVEMTRNVDGLRLSTFFVKERNERLRLGPVWDYNLSLGNAATFGGWHTEGWHQAPLDGPSSSWDCTCGNQDTVDPLPPDQVAFCGEGCSPFWFEQLFSDDAFVARYRTRWQELREGPLSNESLIRDIDAAIAAVEEAAVRNYERWDVLGRPLYGNTFVGATWQEELEYLRTWLLARVAWMDSQLS